METSIWGLGFRVQGLGCVFSRNIIKQAPPYWGSEALFDLCLLNAQVALKWGFPKFRGTLFGIFRISIRVFWGLYWVPPIQGNYKKFEFPMRFQSR